MGSTIVSFLSALNNCLLPCLLPARGGSNALRPGCCDYRDAPRIPLGPCVPLASCTPLASVVFFLSLLDLCRPVLREVPGLGRSVGRAAVVVRSVKLVHQPIEAGEAGMCSWPGLPVSDPRPSCSARFCRSVKPPLLSTCRCQVPARSHDGSPCANPCRGGRHVSRANSP
jgi:hypothetical protein